MKFAEETADPRFISAEELARRRGAVNFAATELRAIKAEVLSTQAAVVQSESRPSQNLVRSSNLLAATGRLGNRDRTSWRE